jgi:drug/metabolite transporter (DMT)-like permease
MLIATSLFGVSSAVVSSTDASRLWLLAIYGLVIGVPTLLWGLRVRRPLRARWVATLFLLDTLTVGGFFVALGLAPVGPAVALHLTAPVLIVLYEIVWQRHPVTSWRAATLGLIVLGCALAAYSTGTSGGGSLAFLGLALALLSAVGVALTNVLAVHLAAVEGNWQLVVGLSSLARAAACTVIAVLAGSELAGDGARVVAAAVVVAIAVPLMWAGAAPRLAPRTMSIIGLNEAVVATVVAVVAFGKGLTPAAALATVIILAAIAVELLEPAPTTAPLPATATG